MKNTEFKTNKTKNSEPKHIKKKLSKIKKLVCF